MLNAGREVRWAMAVDAEAENEAQAGRSERIQRASFENSKYLRTVDVIEQSHERVRVKVRSEKFVFDRFVHF